MEIFEEIATFDSGELFLISYIFPEIGINFVFVAIVDSVDIEIHKDPCRYWRFWH